MKKVLNVGGNSKAIPLPEQYDGWEHILLDIDPTGNPDVVCDARELNTLSASEYDSVYCSHNLEHYHHHEAKKVLAGFIHILKDDGFVFIRVPDMAAVMKTVVEKGLDIDDILYQSAAGPIMVRDVMYGWGKQIEESGCDFFAHKTGFTQKSLRNILQTTGFSWIFTSTGNLEVMAVAFKNQPTEEAMALFKLPIDTLNTHYIMTDFNKLALTIKDCGRELGFSQVGISDTDLSTAEQHLHHWLARGFHGDMDYMQRHGNKRSRPALLQENTVRVISVRLDYLPENRVAMKQVLDNPTAAYISRYALGRDYHKLMRQRLQKLIDKIHAELAERSTMRAFVDSAPVMEKAIAEKAGLGWIGKHSNVINRQAGW